MNYTSASISELEAKVREIGELLFAADGNGGAPEETLWCEVMGNSMTELSVRGEEGRAGIVRLFQDFNLEVKLSAACVALEKDFEVETASLVLEELCSTRGGNGWPAHYAQKVLARYRRTGPTTPPMPGSRPFSNRRSVSGVADEDRSAKQMTAPEIRRADLSRDLNVVRELWLEYLTWGNDQMEAAHGFRFPVQETVDRDMAKIAKFMPPDGCMLLAFVGDEAAGIACLQRIGPRISEVKRMYVRPAHRRAGLGRALLERLIDTARESGYATLRLDSPDFMSAAHALYRSRGFVSIGAYPESEIPDEFKRHWMFMEKILG